MDERHRLARLGLAARLHEVARAEVGGHPRAELHNQVAVTCSHYLAIGARVHLAVRHRHCVSHVNIRHAPRLDHRRVHAPVGAVAHNAAAAAKDRPIVPVVRVERRPIRCDRERRRDNACWLISRRVIRRVVLIDRGRHGFHRAWHAPGDALSEHLALFGAQVDVLTPLGEHLEVAVVHALHDARLVIERPGLQDEHLTPGTQPVVGVVALASRRARAVMVI